MIGHALRACVLALVCALLLTVPPKSEASYPAPIGVTVKGVHAGTHQRDMIGRVLATCRMLGARPKVQWAAIATITQESTARNLVGGDLDSVGLFQIRAMHIRGQDKRRVPEWAAAWFCNQAIRTDRLWPHLGVGRLAQSVQRSAHPSLYQQWVGEAQRTTRKTMAALACG